jgi:hypothetical protein
MTTHTANKFGQNDQSSDQLYHLDTAFGVFNRTHGCFPRQS